MKTDKVFCFMAARNEAENLASSLQSLEKQTLKPCKTLVINDGSTDATGKIADDFGCQVVNLPFHKESYTKSPEQNWKLSIVFNSAFKVLNGSCDYFLQMSPDLWLPRNYVSDLVSKMKENNKIVIASGEIYREPVIESHVRGAGRLYQGKFWRKYIVKYREGFAWESHPLFKAQSLGFEVKSFPELMMLSSRVSSQKASYGFCMDELGYFPVFALGRCFKHILGSDAQTGIRMLIDYLRGSPFEPDETVAKFVRLQQIKRILNMIVGK